MLALFQPPSVLAQQKKEHRHQRDRLIKCFPEKGLER
jgi:hypothetical protein